MKKLLLLITLLCCFNCTSQDEKKALDKPKKESKTDSIKIHTAYSKQPNTYLGFNSPKAINRIATIENEYFNSYTNSYSRYYGTVWGQSSAKYILEGDSISMFARYQNELTSLNQSSDSMHCTIYAMHALKAGLDSNFTQLDKYHKQIWKDREYAGWSVGYILVKYFNWSAYAFVAKHSVEYDRCMKNYRNHKKYYVWKQPDIPLTGIYDVNQDKAPIDSLLAQHEFGWGFSNQGIHTWITRYKDLKECNWVGAPSIKYDEYGYNVLFKKTYFLNFTDYASHVIIFPPKS